MIVRSIGTIWFLTIFEDSKYDVHQIEIENIMQVQYSKVLNRGFLFRTFFQVLFRYKRKKTYRIYKINYCQHATKSFVTECTGVNDAFGRQTTSCQLIV